MSYWRRWLEPPSPVSANGYPHICFPFYFGRRWLAPPSPVGAEWLVPQMFPLLLWAPNGWPHLLLFAPMAGPTEVSPSPSIHRLIYADLPPSCLFCPPLQVLYPSWWCGGGGGWCLNHCPQWVRSNCSFESLLDITQQYLYPRINGDLR